MNASAVPVEAQTPTSLEAHRPALRRYFSKRVPAAEVDDLVQDVFLRMQVHGQEQSIDHLDRYLFTVAASVLSDTRRRCVVRHGDEHESLEEGHHPTEDRTPERVILDREALDMAVRAIAALPERTRDVFVLHRFEEMSCRAIGAQLGISESAVEKHVMKALRFLNDNLPKERERE